MSVAREGLTQEQRDNFSALTDEQRAVARRLLGATNIRESLSRETAARLQSLGI